MNQQARISINTAIVMVVFAVCVDMGQIFIEWTLDWILVGLALNWLIDLAMEFGYWLWFRSLGVKFKGMKAVIFIGLGFFKLFPGLDEFPLWTLDVVAVIFMTGLEDKLGMSTKQIMGDERTRKILKRGIMGKFRQTVTKNPMLNYRANQKFDESSDNSEQGERARKLAEQRSLKERRQNVPKNIPNEHNPKEKLAI